jgi:hypothetical protein
MKETEKIESAAEFVNLAHLATLHVFAPCESLAPTGSLVRRTRVSAAPVRRAASRPQPALMRSIVRSRRASQAQ